MLSDMLFVVSLFVGVYALLMIINKRIKFHYNLKKVLDSDTYRELELKFTDSIYLYYIIMIVSCCLQSLSFLIDIL